MLTEEVRECGIQWSENQPEKAAQIEARAEMRAELRPRIGISAGAVVF